VADTVSFKYDPFGRRIQKLSASATTNYLYEGDNLLEEVDSSGKVFVLLLIDALTLHPGLAKDAATSFPDAARFFLLQFAVLGLPFVLLNTLIGITAVRILKGSRWTASRRRRGSTK